MNKAIFNVMALAQAALNRIAPKGKDSGMIGAGDSYGQRAVGHLNSQPKRRLNRRRAV